MAKGLGVNVFTTIAVSDLSMSISHFHYNVFFISPNTLAASIVMSDNRDVRQKVNC
jgi:hypothetical protein